MLNTRYIPENSTTITRDELPAVVYAYTSKSGNLAAIAYLGKSNKPAWHYRFTTDAQREARINDLFDSVNIREAAKQERKAQKQAFHHGYQPGDILDGSWGYDQTNREFYQVVKVNPSSNSIVIRAIAHEAVQGTGGFMCVDVMPVKDSFVGPERRAMVSPSYRGQGKGSLSVTVEINGQWSQCGTRVYLGEWDGRPSYSSWYA